VVPVLIARLQSLARLGWLTGWRVRGYSRILLGVSLVSVLFSYREALGPTGSDFLAFWSAGQLVVQGASASVYDVAATGAVQAELGRDAVFAFVNPPPMLLMVWPLGLLSYPVAWLVWVILGWAGWFVLARRQDKRFAWPIAAYPGALLAAGHAQTGFLTSAMQGGFATLLARRPFAAGLCLGCLVIKPHLAVLAPVALVAARQWRAFWGAALAVLGLLLASWIVFGTPTMLAYRQGAEVSAILMGENDAEFFLRQVTVYASIRALGLPLAAAIAQAAATLGVAGVVWRYWRTDAPLDGKLALLMAATPLATPYLFAYDLPFLIIPTMWLASRAADHPRGGWERTAILLLYIAPLAVRAAALPLHFVLMPFVSVAMMVMIVRRLEVRAAPN